MTASVYGKVNYQGTNGYREMVALVKSKVMGYRGAKRCAMPEFT